MTAIVDWAANHVRMVLACLLLSIGAGVTAYTQLPKEGAPDINIPAYFVSVPYPGISAEDSEKLLVIPLESRLRDIDGLKAMTSTAAEGYAGVALEFEFNHDKASTLATIRDKVSQAEASFPGRANVPVISEFSFSQFPILVVVLSGQLPERTLQQLAKRLREVIEGVPGVLEVGLTGRRTEMLEVLIDPLKLEAYDVTAEELVRVATSNNQLIAAGEVEAGSGAFALKVPSTFSSPQDVRSLPVKVNGGRVVTLGELASIRMTFEDRSGYARHNGSSTIALQVVKRKGFNVIGTSDLVQATVLEEIASWPEEQRNASSVAFAQDLSKNVEAMVSQLESSVLTAVALVMIVVLAALGLRSALLVGFAIPTSFLLCFTFLSVMQIAISNIVMFGMILAVGMLVDSAIVVVELGDRRIAEGSRPMAAYVEAAKRMFWPIVSSTATTLCAFLPMLFWPGVPGQFMGTLPVTIMFVLSASLVVALVVLPVVGGVAARFSMNVVRMARALSFAALPTRLLLFVLCTGLLLAASAMLMAPWLLPLPPAMTAGPVPRIVGAVLFAVLSVAMSVVVNSFTVGATERFRSRRQRRTIVGATMGLIVGNPVMPVVVVAAVVAGVAAVFQYYSVNNYGVRFFVDAEPERAKVTVLARGNLSLRERNELVAGIEEKIVGTEGIASVFGFTGDAGLSDFSGADGPVDAIGEVQIEFNLWEDRQLMGGDAVDSRAIVENIEGELESIVGIKADVQTESTGPQAGKPISLRLASSNWEELLQSAQKARDKFDETPGLVFVDDSRPLPGIDWVVDVDLEEAGRFGADVATVGALVQLVTRGILLDTMRVDTSDEEIDIRVRFPEEDRVLSTINALRVRTSQGLIPLANFVSLKPVQQLAQLNRYNEKRFVTINAGLKPGLTNEAGRPITPTERIQLLGDWLENEAELPPGVSWEWTGDQEEQQESQTFLMYAFIGALGLMFAVLLAQFDSVYNAVLVILAVVLSTAGVLVGMLVLKQPFSIIMTGTGIVALAGIVVNNNIVLIDTYQEYAKYLPRIEAIVRTVEIRLRPVFLTSITTIAGLTPMMFGISIDLVDGGYSLGTPASLWWKQLASAVVFGLGTATALTLVFTPSLLAIRVWSRKGAYWSVETAAAIFKGRSSQVSLDRRLRKSLAKIEPGIIPWDQFQHIFLPDRRRQAGLDFPKPIVIDDDAVSGQTDQDMQTKREDDPESERSSE